jgi:DNA-binding response OmpR family regulator
VDDRIIIIDDDPHVHDVVGAYLQGAGFLLHAARTGREGLDLIRLKDPALVVLDLGLPDMSGRQVCAEVRRRSEVPILMLTAADSVEDLVLGLAEGADDYVAKPYSPREVLARVRALLRRTGGGVTPGRVLRFDDGAFELDPAAHEVTRHGIDVELTPSEFKLLLALARFPGRACSRTELLHHVQGDDFAGYARTVDTHVTNLRRKLEDDPAEPRHILTVWKAGYRFES